MLQQICFCRISGYLFLFLLTGFFSGVKAQTSPPNPIYVSWTYLKTLPGKFDAYDSLLRNYSKKIVDREIKDGNYLQWSVYEVLMPTGEQAEHNVVVIAVSNKMDQLLDPPGTAKEVFAKNFPNLSEAQRSDIMKSYGTNRTLVKKEIYRVISSTSENGPPTKTPTKYVQVDYMTPVDGKEQDYVKMEVETFKPVHLERIKLGAVQGWVMLEKILPGDTNDPAPFVTVNFYNNFDGMMDGKYPEAVKKAHPNTDSDKIFASINTVKKDQRIEVWKLMVTDTMQGAATK